MCLHDPAHFPIRSVAPEGKRRKFRWGIGSRPFKTPAAPRLAARQPHPKLYSPWLKNGEKLIFDVVEWVELLFIDVFYGCPAGRLASLAAYRACEMQPIWCTNRAFWHLFEYF